MRYRARCEYDGTDFAGFQFQLNARSVQGELETALARLSGGERVTVDGAGRTDTGVHATGQVIAFTFPRQAHRGGAPAGGQRPAAEGCRDPRPPPRSPRVPSPLCGAVPGIPLHRLERAAKPAARADSALAAGPAGHRRHGERRVGLRGPARLLGLRHNGPVAGPDRPRGPGPEGREPGDDRRQGRLLPPGAGAADGGRPPGGRPRQDG